MSDSVNGEHDAPDPRGSRPQGESGFAGFAQLTQLAQLLSSMDAAGMVTSVGQALTWARESIVAPHAGHTDPAAHPECVICRGMSIVQSSASSAGAEATAAPEDASPSGGIRWVPVRRIERPHSS